MPKPVNQTKPLPSTTRSLPMALNRAREGVMPPIRDMLAESGLTEQQWRVLRVLSEFGPQSTSLVAKRSSLLLPSLTRITKKMQSNGLIKITRDELDKRRQTISITRAGQRVINKHADEASRIVKTLRKRIGAKQYDQLLELLALLEPFDEKP